MVCGFSCVPINLGVFLGFGAFRFGFVLLRWCCCFCDLVGWCFDGILVFNCCVVVWSVQLWICGFAD